MFRSSIGSARSAAMDSSAGDGPTSIPSAAMFSSRARPKSSTRCCLQKTASRGAMASLGFDVQGQAVEVGALLNTGRVHAEGNLQNRGVDGVNRDTANLAIADLCSELQSRSRDRALR